MNRRPADSRSRTRPPKWNLIKNLKKALGLRETLVAAELLWTRVFSNESYMRIGPCRPAGPDHPNSIYLKTWKRPSDWGGPQKPHNCFETACFWMRIVCEWDPAADPRPADSEAEPGHPNGIYLKTWKKDPRTEGDPRSGRIALETCVLEWESYENWTPHAGQARPPKFNLLKNGKKEHRIEGAPEAT